MVVRLVCQQINLPSIQNHQFLMDYHKGHKYAKTAISGGPFLHLYVSV